VGRGSAARTCGTAASREILPAGDESGARGIPDTRNVRQQMTVNGSSVEILLDMADLVRPNAVRAAAALKLADHLSGRPMTAGELAERAGAHEGMLGKLLRYLVELGILDADD